MNKTLLVLASAATVAIGAGATTYYAQAQSDDKDLGTPIVETKAVAKLRPTSFLVQMGGPLQVRVDGLAADGTPISETTTIAIVAAQGTKLQGFAVDKGGKAADCALRRGEILGRSGGQVTVNLKKVLDDCF